MRFWAFQCSFLINNNFSMAEVFVGGTRKELLAAMSDYYQYISTMHLDTMAGTIF